VRGCPSRARGFLLSLHVKNAYVFFEDGSLRVMFQ
jgi:hypothetical protein